MEEEGVYMAIIIAESTLAMVAMIMFRKREMEIAGDMMS